MAQRNGGCLQKATGERGGSVVNYTCPACKCFRLSEVNPKGLTKKATPTTRTCMKKLETYTVRRAIRKASKVVVFLPSSTPPPKEVDMKLELNLNDRLKGRPIRCNKQRLEPKNSGKNYAEVLFIGDTHLGSPQFDQQKFLNMIDYAKKHSMYVLLMGDLLEMSTRTSIGAGIYEQDLIGQSQHEQMVEWLRPLADRGLILGTHRGNHESRVYQATGVDISKALARELGIPYLADACWSRFSVGKEHYSLYTMHGRTGARFDGTALLALERISVSFHADLVCDGSRSQDHLFFCGLCRGLSTAQ